MEHHRLAVLRHDAFDEDMVVRMNIPEQSSDLLGMLTAMVSRDRYPRRTCADGLNRAAQHGHFCAFQVSLDVIQTLPLPNK